ncbi:MAG: LysE family translocator [Gammaproteobacteria bacterium]|nr:LysE family translocator [Gammaproteobacteria bacterium]
MDLTLYISFVIISAGLIIVPGPNVIAIVSTSIAFGTTRGLQCVAGTTLAMSIQLIIAALGTTWIIQLLADGFHFLKWLGVLYLFYLGFRHLRTAYSTGSVISSTGAINTFARGFIVSLTNPKTILFFAAFLPQFIISTEDYLQQMALLSITFLVLALLLDSCYAIFSSRLTKIFKEINVHGFQHGISGVLFLVAGIWLAAIRRAG